MKVDEIIPGTPVIFYQKVSLAGFLSDPIETEILTAPWHTSAKHFCKVKGHNTYVDIEHLAPLVTSSKRVKELQSMINRLKGYIEQVKVMDIFTDYDRKILVPRYESNLLVLERKLERYEREDAQKRAASAT
ncbi:hypothetical protein [Leeuwenhoekiella sp. CH_XMU1409-2]|uniref:hypothetical protein n=1 Tax=Leeuwenhoekiella sp. CH_XMU1409-2 TaxID=3107768 RepID=UPI00300AA35D